MSVLRTSINPVFNRAFVLHLANRIAGGNGEQGRILERLAAYVMLTIPGMQVASRLLSHGGEIDILVRNNQSVGLPLKWIGDYFLIECKDTADKVDEKEYGHFLTKLTLCKTKQGAIFSRNGLTGAPQYEFASRDQKLAYSQGEFVVLDIKLSELVNLQSTADLLVMMQQKYEQLRFGHL
jgi:hypothetical protein